MTLLSLVVRRFLDTQADTFGEQLHSAVRMLS